MSDVVGPNTKEPTDTRAQKSTNRHTHKTTTKKVSSHNRKIYPSLNEDNYRTWFSTKEEGNRKKKGTTTKQAKKKNEKKGEGSRNDQTKAKEGLSFLSCRRAGRERCLKIKKKNDIRIRKEC